MVSRFGRSGTDDARLGGLMLCNTYAVTTAGISSVDADLLDRLRLMQERLALLLEGVTQEAAHPDEHVPRSRSPIGPGKRGRRIRR